MTQLKTGLASDQFISNLHDARGLVEEVEFQGETHLKVPAVAIKESVLEYPDSNQLVPAEEIKRTKHLWNNTPIVIEHPTRRGQPVSANEPEIIEQEELGRVFNPRMNGKKLVVDMFLSMERLREHPEGSQLQNRIRNGELTEVSTSYFQHPIEESGTHNGRKFDKIQNNIIPDHFAIILEGQGRCSVDEGCGFPRRNKKEKEFDVTVGEKDYKISVGNNMDAKELEKSLKQNGIDVESVEEHVCECKTDNARDTARELSWSGTETREEQPWGDVSKNLADYWRGWIQNTDAGGDVDDPPTWEESPNEFRQWVSEKNFLGEMDADTFAEGLILPVVNPMTDNLNEGALIAAKAAVSGARGADFSPQQEESVTDAVNELLVSEFDFDEEEFEMNKQEETGFQKFKSWMRRLVSNEEEESELVSNGEALASLLNDAIDEMAMDMAGEDMSESEARSEIIDDMASAADIAASTVRSILNAEIDRPPNVRLRGFVEVLDGVSQADVEGALQEDGFEDVDITNSKDNSKMDNEQKQEAVEEQETAEVEEETQAEVSDEPEAVTEEEETAEVSEEVKATAERGEGFGDLSEEQISKLFKLADLMANKEDLDEALEGVTKQHRDYKESLVSDLVANEQCCFEEKELKEKDISELRKLHRSIQPTHRGGQALPEKRDNSTESVPTPPSVVRPEK